jgi:hypothetical protein
MTKSYPTGERLTSPPSGEALGRGNVLPVATGRSA